MTGAINLGFSRMGAQRELKKALESYWSGKTSTDQLIASARLVREQVWAWQKEAGLNDVPTGDFSLYDHVLDTAWTFGAIPERFRKPQFESELDRYFAMARGSVGSTSVQALEMTKWFDTNYHYIVPEIDASQQFKLNAEGAIGAYREAKALGYSSRPVLLGPVSFLLLAKMRPQNANPLALLDRLLPEYHALLQSFHAEGATWVQLDEPVLATDIDEEVRQAVRKAVETFKQGAPELKILLATYFGDLRDNLESALNLPIDALHLDLVRGPEQLDKAVQLAPAHLSLSLGLVDGRNIWKTDLDRALQLAEKAVSTLSKSRIMVAPSCSLLHVPVDLAFETKLPTEIKDWLAFGRQKLAEVVTLAKGIEKGRNQVGAELEQNRESLDKRRHSKLVHDDAVQKGLAAIQERDFVRAHTFDKRRDEQQRSLGLPLFPTTTIGSFPQTAELRQQRSRAKKNEISQEQYDSYLRHEISTTIKQQEALDIDVLVHGEAERNDMVEYFGELLRGYAFTENGWVQSYGSRCVKPPIIYGDVSRPKPMTVGWWQYAQSQATRPVKGMLTGPVTMLQWSFVRDDQPRRDTCFQLALAIRQEIVDLEAAGCRVIQLDEPALREGLPLRQSDAAAYLKWAVDAFRLASAAVQDATQVHTHMCYAEFNEIIESIAAMDADVISMESARSQMELLDAFVEHGYRNEIGPGVYDIHSPRVPSTQEITAALERALKVIPKQQLWVNPDCGLKTRRWEEVTPALTNMIAAAKQLRQQSPPQ